MFSQEDDDRPKSHNEIVEMPIYKKGEEIIDIVQRILDLAPKDNEMLEHTISWMRESAYMLCVKVAGAEGGGLYDLKMENAALIRKAARELVVNTHALDMHDYPHPEYFKVLRNAVEEYRVLFVEWVEGFDPWDYVIDRWGLFNPPGVTAHDKDPDEDIPFDPKKFFEDFEDGLGEDDEESLKTD